MFENEKCCIGLKRDGGYVIPHDPDGWTDSVQCDEPVVALERYADFKDTILPVCAEHRPLIQMIYEDFKAWEARSNRPTANGSARGTR
jgi:hypothetical protein